MGKLFEKIAEWLQGILVDAAMDNLTSLFDSVNEEVQSIAGEVGTSPADFAPSVFGMIRNVSETVILPIAGVIITFIACYELIWNAQAYIKSAGLIWPLFYTAVFYLLFSGLLTILFGWIERKMDYFRV